MKNSTNKKKETQGTLSYLKDPTISSVMLQIASFENGLSKKELEEILNRTKDNKNGKGISWALKILEKEKLIKKQRGNGTRIKITNNKTDNDEIEINKVEIQTTNYKESYSFIHTPASDAPIEYFISTFEENAPQHEKEAYTKVKQRLIELHKPLTDIHSLNPKKRNEQIEIDTPEKVKLAQKMLLETNDIEKIKKHQEILNDWEKVTNSVNRLNESVKKKYEKWREDSKELVHIQRRKEFNYAKWLVNELEGIILIDLFTPLCSTNGNKLKNEENYLVPILIKDKILLRTELEVCVGLILALDETKKRSSLLAWLKTGIVNYLKVPFTEEEIKIYKESGNIINE